MNSALLTHPPDTGAKQVRCCRVSGAPEQSLLVHDSGGRHTRLESVVCPGSEFLRHRSGMAEHSFNKKFYEGFGLPPATQSSEPLLFQAPAPKFLHQTCFPWI